VSFSVHFWTKFHHKKSWKIKIVLFFVKWNLSRPRAVIPKVCSADHWWSVRLAEVVRESLYKSIFCPSRTTKILKVVREPKKFGNHWPRGRGGGSVQNGEKIIIVLFLFLVKVMSVKMSLLDIALVNFDGTIWKKFID